MAELLTSEVDHELVTRDEFLFLYPFKLQKQNQIEALWALVYKGNDNAFLPPKTARFESALSRGDWKAAGPEASIIVNSILDMPSVAADKYQAPLIKALEFLELEPFLSGMDARMVVDALGENPTRRDTSGVPSVLQDVLSMRSLDRQKVDELIAAKPNHPRIATLRFVSLRKKFAREVPDGWAYDIRTKVSKETWKGLEQSADQWLKDYPQHPLADLVRFWKIRIYYFEGDEQRAWDQLASLYPRRLPRVLYEIRYMLNFSQPPADVLVKIKDPVLLSALLSSIQTSPETWDAWWKLSEENRSQSWASNLQERLLAKTVGQQQFSDLPAQFPKDPRNPTPLWGKLRALALMKSCRWEEAGKQLFSLAPDSEQAVLAAAYHLRQGKITLAAQVLELPADIRRYLIRVMVDDEGLQRLATSKNPDLQKEALFDKAVRFSQRGKWTEAADIVRTAMPSKSGLWEHAASLRPGATTAGSLRWARFLKDNNGKLFYGNDSTWYRSLNWRMRSLSHKQEHLVKRAKGAATNQGSGEESTGCTPEMPWTPEHEEEAISDHFVRTAEMWLALQAYADWLSSAKPSAEMSAAVKEADVCYNWLVNWDSTNSRFWSDYLSDSTTVKQIREAGKRARKK